eukprot:5876603-Pyramimonas_sp.AAC.1
MGTHQAVREGVAHYLLYEDPRWQGGAVWMLKGYLLDEDPRRQGGAGDLCEEGGQEGDANDAHREESKRQPGRAVELRLPHHQNTRVSRKPNDQMTSKGGVTFEGLGGQA